MSKLWSFRLACVHLLFVAIFFAGSAALAQTESGTVSGQLTDPSGAVVSGASVRLIDIERDTAEQTHTNSEGLYSFANVRPGRYRIEVKKDGFKISNVTGITVNVQDRLAENVQLELGSAAESVTVKGGGININTTDGTVSTLVNSTIVENMPLNGRSFQDLILLTPGVVGGSPISYPNQAEEVGGFSVNGQRPDANYYTVDGVSANVPSTGAAALVYGPAGSGSQGPLTSLGTTQALVSVDDMQEFRVQTSSYAAEYGRYPGGQIGVQTKSGNNTFHGDVYDYLRNSGAGAANDYFYNYDNLPQTPGNPSTPPLRQNDFGGAFGGPIRIPHVYNGKDRTFFYVNYEGLRLTSPGVTSVNLVPDLCLRGQATTADPCPSGVTPAFVPTSSSPAGAQSIQTILRAFPSPNFQAESPVAGNAGLGEDVVAPVGTGVINNYSIRLDQILTDKMNIFFRFSNTTSASASLAGGGTSGPISLTRTYTAGVNNIFTNKLSNEFRFNYSSSSATGGSNPSAYAYTDAASTPCASAGASAAGTCGVGGTTVPITNFSAAFGLPPSVYPTIVPVNSSAAFNLGGLRTFDQQTQWNPVDTMSYTVGAHQFKFGVDYRRIPGTVEPPSSAVYDISLPNLESGVFSFAPPSSITIIGLTAFAPFYPVYTNFSAFAQDTWKTTRRLTLSLGLRWDVNPAPGVWQGNMPYTITGTSVTNYALACTNGPETAGQSCDAGTPFWQTTWFNFAPRFGVAYQVRTNPGWQTVVRGGFGVFYDTGQQEGSLSYQGPGFASARTPIPTYLDGCTFPGFGVTGCTQASPLPAPVYPVVPSSTAALYGAYPHLQLPYTLQWNVSVEQGLGRSQSLTISYVGSHGGRLLEELEYGLPAGKTNPNGTTFFLAQNGPTSDYDALQAHFQRQFSRGLTLLASYTWSHCIDYGSVNFEIGLQRGNCDYDLRQNFSSSFSYNLPNFGRNAIVKAVLDHWGVDDYLIARTGYPLFLKGNAFVNPATGTEEYNAVDEVLGQPQWLYGSNCVSMLTTLHELTGGIGSTLCPGGRALNPCSFASASTSTTGVVTYGPVNARCLPTGTTTYTSSQLGGVAPRNGLRGYDAVQMNMAIRREFPIYERLKLQFRAEAFNIFNHPNFGQFALTAGSAQFGLATQTLASAAGSFGAGGGLSTPYQTGGPRTMQFALKLIF